MEKFTSKELGEKFNTLDFGDFITLLRGIIKNNPDIQIDIVASYLNKQKAREAKALIDLYRDRLKINSITIKGTGEQFGEEVNNFQSGVKFEEEK